MEWPGSLVAQIREAAGRVAVIRDPDRLLLQEQMIAEIRDAGFEIVTMDDPVYLRHAWESKFLEEPLAGTAAARLLIRLERQRYEDIPYDIWQGAVQMDLSLTRQFELLDARVLRDLLPEDLAALKRAYDAGHPATYQGGKATAGFVLRHAFGMAPDTWHVTVDILRALLALHYRGRQLTPVLLDELEGMIPDLPGVGRWPLRQLFGDRQFFFGFLQQHWLEFLQRTAGGLEYGEVPFADPEVRVYLDNLFTEGYLRPVPFEARESCPQWMISGIVADPGYYRQLRLEKLANLLRRDLPGMDGHYRDWLQTAARVAEIGFLRAQSAAPPDTEQSNLSATVREARELFFAWFERRQGALASLMMISQPVMVHHIPHYLAWRRSKAGVRIALVVLDGMSWQQWLAVKPVLTSTIDGLSIEERQVFSLVPTLTSFCRQAIFAGVLPFQFGGSVFDNSGEEKSWRAFWRRQPQPPSGVALLKSLAAGAEDLELVRQHCHVEVLGLVIDTIDKLVHAQQLGPAGLQRDVELWLQQGCLTDLIDLLLQSGYEVYLASDHGNIACTGCGRPDEGCLVETGGQRARLYKSQGLYDSAARSIPGSRRWQAMGLPNDLFVLLAGDDSAFVNRGDNIMSHGGSAIDEVVAPFIKLTRGA